MKTTKLLIIISLIGFSCSRKNNNAELALNVKLPLNDTTLLFFSRDTGFYLNNNYIAQISDIEKAAVGYVATFIGCDCWWDGDEVAEGMTNLDCKIISALGLGYQCSDTHLGFLREWFAQDSVALESLESSRCPKMPFTATRQSTFDEITLTTKEDTIIIYYEANAIDVRAEATWYWTETDFFLVNKKGLLLLKEERSEVIKESFGHSAELGDSEY